MSLWSRLFGKQPPPDTPDWPAQGPWGTRVDGETLQTGDGPMYLWTIPCGDLALPGGRLVACDPFACLRPGGNPHIQAPVGRFPVIVTLADVSEAQDRSHIREAYTSIVFAEGEEARRTAVPLLTAGQKPPSIDVDQYVGFPVDSGTACFVDDTVLTPCMPSPETWYEALFDTGEPDSWFARMDDPDHIREGIANIPLPLGQNGENLILFHSGWGDGVYPVIGSLDAAGSLLAAHIDFLVVG